MSWATEKTANLLAFLNATASIRHKRVYDYGTEDKVLWFADIPSDSAECRSPFLAGEADEDWLEVRKKREPIRPAMPRIISGWVPDASLDDWKNDPEPLPEMIVLSERRAPNPGAPPEAQSFIVEKVPERHRLIDHPEVQDEWLKYLIEQWQPWAQEMRRWKQVQDI